MEKYCSITECLTGAPTAASLPPFSAGQGRENIKTRLMDLDKDRDRSLRIMGKADLPVQIIIIYSQSK